MQASLVPSLLFPDTEHSGGSFPHPSPLCSRNTQPTISRLDPSIVPAQTCISLATPCQYSVLSTQPRLRCCTWVENLPRCAHGPVGHFARCTRSRDNTSGSRPTLSSGIHPLRLPTLGTDIAVSTQCDTCTDKHSGLVFLSPSIDYTTPVQKKTWEPDTPPDSRPGIC